MPWETFNAASDGLATLDDEDDISPFILLSSADVAELASRGAESSFCVCNLEPEPFDFTTIGAGSDFFVVSGAEPWGVSAAIRITGGLAELADALSSGVDVADLSPRICATELVWPEVLFEGACAGVDIGDMADEPCWGAVTGQSWRGGGLAERSIANVCERGHNQDGRSHDQDLFLSRRCAGILFV